MIVDKYLFDIKSVATFFIFTEGEDLHRKCELPKSLTRVSHCRPEYSIRTLRDHDVNANENAAVYTEEGRF